MASDDLPVIVYKLLAYIYECMKREAVPTEAQARELTQANDTMLYAAVEAALSKGLLSGVEIKRYFDGGARLVFSDAMLTLDGAEYLLENSTMQKAANVAGAVWTATMEAAVQAVAKVSGLM